MDKVAPRHMGMKRRSGAPSFLIYRLIETGKRFKKVPFHRFRKSNHI